MVTEDTGPGPIAKGALRLARAASRGPALGLAGEITDAFSSKSSPADASGNPIDMSRPDIGAADGPAVTERTIGITADIGNGERFYNIPTVVNGKEVSSEEAIRLFEQGQNPPVGEFGSQAEADAAAVQRSERIGEVRKDGPGAIKRGFVSGMVELNPMLTAEALEGLSYLAPEEMRETLLGASESARGLSDLNPEEYRMRSKSLWDSESASEAMTWAGEALGQGLSSTVPSIIMGLAGSATASRLGGRKAAVPGALAGAAVPSAALNYGEVYRALKEEGIAPEAAAEYGALAAGPMVALDTISVGPIITRLGGMEEAKRQFARSFARRIASEAGKGAGREGVTEALQEVVKEVTVSLAADKPFWTVENLGEITEAGIAGAMVGGTMGGAAGVRADRTAPAAPKGALGNAVEEADRAMDEAAATAAASPATAPQATPETATAPETAPGVDVNFLNAYPEDALTADESTSRDLGVHSEPNGTGERTDPVRIERPEDVHAGAEATAAPTEAQKEAGNYKKRHVQWQGLDISIETEMGQERSGVSPDGTAWSVTQPAPYGYIKRTEAADGEHMDVYVGPEPQAPTVFVVDQVDLETGKFDEHKAMLGFPTEEAARATYEAAFSDGRGGERLGAVTPMPVEQFKAWVKDGDTKAALALREEAETAAPVLSAEEAKDFYQAVGSAQINRFLREGTFPNVQFADRPKAEAAIKALKQAAVPAPADMTVYRGMPGKEVGPDKGFVSVTTDEKIAHDHARKVDGGVLVRMTLPAGTPVVDMPAGEQEYLLLPGADIQEMSRRRRDVPSSVGRRSIPVVEARIGSEGEAVTDPMVTARATAEEVGLVLEEEYLAAAADAIARGEDPLDAVYEAAERQAMADEAGAAALAEEKGVEDGWDIPFDDGETRSAEAEAARPGEEPASAQPADEAEAAPGRGEPAEDSGGARDGVVPAAPAEEMPLDTAEARGVEMFSRTAGADTNSEAFRAWFGDSKVVDADGKPLVVYHGTPAGEFAFFDTLASSYGLMGQGGYFTESPRVASEYTEKGAPKMRRRGETPAPTVYPVHLRIHNPMDMASPADISAWVRAYRDYASRDDFEGVVSNEDAYRRVEDILENENLPSYEGAEIMQDGLRAMGYDGITHEGGGRLDKNSERHRVWIAFSPTQIKSVFNRGTFDPSDPRIAYAMREPLVALAGDEVGFAYAGPESMPALRKAAQDWFDANLRGQTVTTKDGFEVRFNRKGRGKSTNAKGHRILQAVPAIREIVENGDVVFREPGRKADQVERIIIAAPVEVAGERMTLGVSVHKYSNGNYQYDFSTWEGAESPGVGVPGGSAKFSASPHPAAKSASGDLNLFVYEGPGNEVSLDALQARLRETGLSDKVSVRLVEEIRNAQGEAAPAAQGRYFTEMIDIAIHADNRAWVLNHEIVHALRDLGLFRRAEWDTLRRAALADKERHGTARRLYPDLSEEGVIEETIANMFADWSADRDRSRDFGSTLDPTAHVTDPAARHGDTENVVEKNAKNPANYDAAQQSKNEPKTGLFRLFEKIRDFFRALGRALTGAGIQSAEDIFRRVDTGEIGARQPFAEWTDADFEEALQSEPRYARPEGDTVALDGFMAEMLPDIDAFVRTAVSDAVRYLPPEARALLNERVAAAAEPGEAITAIAEAIEVTLRGRPTPANLSKAAKDSYRRLLRTAAANQEARVSHDEADFIANMLLEPREPGRKKKARKGAPADVAGALKSLRRAPKLPDPGDYGWMSRFLLHPYQIATKDAQFADVFHWAQEFNRLRNEAQVLLGQVVEPYMNLDEKQRANINKVLEIGRLEGKDYSADETISVRNDGNRHAMLPVGESITLTPEERQGYLAVRAMFDRALLMFKQQVLAEANLGGPGDPRTAAGIRDYSMSHDNELSRQDKQALDRAAEMVEEIERARRSGYIPFSRYGDYSITVTDQLGNVAYFTKIEKGIGARERTAKIREDLEKRFPRSEGYIVQQTRFNPKLDISSLADIDFAVLDDMAKRGGADAETIEAYHSAVQAQWTKEGFRAHFVQSKNLPGYEQDFTRSISDYIVGITGYLARRNAMDPLEQSLARIDPAKQELRKYARRYRDYVFNPVEEYGQWRQLMFYAYLSGNPSSAFLNLMQVPIFTLPFLSMVSNPVKAAAALADASRITMKMFDQRALRSSDKRQAEFLNFDVSKAPADLRADLEALLKEGTLVPMVTLENMGVAQGRKKFLRGAGKKGRQVLEIAGTMFTSAERFNRIVTAVAALRLAQDAKVMARAEEAFGRSNIWQDMSPTGMPGGNSPKGHSARDLARFVIWETHFLQGKMNRPTALRGPGAAIGQFKSFQLNALQVQWRMATLYGAPGKRAFAMNMAMLMMFAGALGITFADDAKELVEWLYRFATNIDLDIEKEMQELAVDLLGEDHGPWIGEAIRRGLLRQAGMDMSQRVGMGKILPFSPPQPAYTGLAQLEQQLEPLGIPGSVLVTALRATDHITNGDWATGLAELSRYPLTAGVANLAKAWAMREEGLRSRNRALLIHPDDIAESDIWLRAAGFQSTRIAREYEKNWMQTRAEGAVSELQSLYYKRLALARSAGDGEEFGRIVREIQAWNADKPEYMRITINAATLNRRVQEERSGRRVLKESAGPVKSRNEKRAIEQIMP